MSQSNPAMPPSAPGGRPPTEYDLRMPHAGPKDTVRGLFFNGVFSAVTAMGGEQSLRLCHQLVDDPIFSRRFVDFSSYPVRDFLRLASAAVAVLAPKVGGVPQAHQRIGEQATNDFFSSMAGRTLLLLSGNSPQRILGTIPTGYGTAVSYGERKVTMIGDNSVRVTYRNELMPPLHTEGVLMGILKAVNAKNPQVRAETKGLLDYDYLLSWD